MANGRIAIGKNSGGIQYIEPTDSASNSTLVLPESGTLATKEATVDIYNSHIPMSNFASYHLIDGNLSVDNFVNTQGFNTTLYTGNGGIQTINTGIDMATQWGNDVSEKFGGLVWIKGRSVAYGNTLQDTVRGIAYSLGTDTTAADSLSNRISNVTSTGFNLAVAGATNNSGTTYASWNFQTTHRVSGTTNHGKAYTCHYNPFTGFTIVKYEGSGIAGHEIPHHLGRNLGFLTVKNLSAVTDWVASYRENYILLLSQTSAEAFNTGYYNSITDIQVTMNSNAAGNNASSNTYILYGWANSYFDESNKLIGNYEIGVYQGTGVAGNKVTTRGKPAFIMVKRLDNTGNWIILDNKRNNISGLNDGELYPNLSNAESAGFSIVTFLEDGFSLQDSSGDRNASGGQYLYMVVYDTNANGGGSYYPKATDNANVQINNAIIPLAKGIDSNGAKNEIVIANETITGVSWEEGKNYPYKTDIGYGKSIHRPRYLKSELIRTYAGEQPDYFDVEKNKWFSCDAGSELVTNGTFDSGASGWTAYLGATLTFINGVMRVTRSSDGYSGAQQQITTEIGKRYRLTANVNKGNDNWGQIGVYSGVPSTSNILGYMRSGINIYIDFIAQSTITYLVTTSDTTGLYAEFDNISVFPTEITPTTEIPESRNYMNHIVHADSQGNPLYVEELPKVKYENTMVVEDLKILSGFDLGQTWQDLKASRTAGVTYTNTTGKPIEVIVRGSSSGAYPFYVNGTIVSYLGGSSVYSTISITVPDSFTYILAAGASVNQWSELR